VVAAAADAIHPPTPGLVVLIYHRIGRRSTLEVDLPLALFEEQLGYLTTRATVVSLEEGLARLRAPVGEHRPLVAVTFDDGTADFAEIALPALTRFGVPATLYVATGFVESSLELPYGGRPLSWGALRDASATGLVTLGSHTHSHALLDRVPEAVAADELDRSIELLGEHTGVATEHFAYPKALLGSPGAQAAVRRRFRSAALAGTRPNRFRATNPYRLARSPVQVADGMRYFTRKARGGMRVEDALRRAVNRRRYAAATS
jgi:peptidoglycan/xylan/chitin deacetylase (PgdA/CDA1 family)